MIVLASQNLQLLQGYLECLRGSYDVLEVPDLLELTRALRSGQPEVAFLDVAILMPKPTIAVNTLSLQYPKVSFVVFGCPDDGSFCLPLLTSGARGLVRLTSPPQLAPKIVEAVKRGELWVTRRGLTVLLHEMQFAGADRLAGPFRLSQRELEVAKIAAAGLSNKEIARSLGISERTVKAHMSSLFVKLGVRDRSELAAANHHRNSDVHVMSQNVENQTVHEEIRATGRGRSRKQKSDVRIPD